MLRYYTSGRYAQAVPQRKGNMQKERSTIPRLLQQSLVNFGNNPAQYWKNKDGEFQPTSYGELDQEVFVCASGLMGLGVGKGSLVGLISENRKEWLLLDLALLYLGAADVPRGNDTMPQELVYILKTTEAKIAVFENQVQLQKILPLLGDLPHLKTAILLDEPEAGRQELKGLKILNFEELMAQGGKTVDQHRPEIQAQIDSASPDDLATIIFTSGTTGEPKGVMISHWNFLTQALYIEDKIKVNPTDIWLCVLPVWHSFERIMQYISLIWGSALAYSKPVGRIMLADFAAIKPTWMASVPRIWESLRAGIYSKVQTDGGAKWALFRFFVAVGKAFTHQQAKLLGRLPRFKRRLRVLDSILAFIPWLLLLPLQGLGSVLVFKNIRARLGGRFIAGISGGGALPAHVDAFFSAAGVLLLEGYGLTETSPVISVRTQWRPVANTIGSPLQYTEAQVRSEEGRALGPGQLGILWVRGPQRMLGYYKRPDLTESILDGEGWLNTGDLAMMTWDGEIAIRGRAKDTIVLLGGENIEPSPIEAKIRDSSFIDQAMVVGQDQKFLGALVQPNQEALSSWANTQGIDSADWEDLCKRPEVLALLRTEVNAMVSTRTGFRIWEQIGKIAIIPKAFEVGTELSGKQDLKRHVISKMYQKEIGALFS